MLLAQEHWCNPILINVQLFSRVVLASLVVCQFVKVHRWKRCQKTLSHVCFNPLTLTI